MTKKRKPKMSDEQRSEKMRGVAQMLLCPHRWGAAQNVRVVDPAGKRKTYDGARRTCELCGTHRVDREDGTSSLISADGLSG